MINQKRIYKDKIYSLHEPEGVMYIKRLRTVQYSVWRRPNWNSTDAYGITKLYHIENEAEEAGITGDALKDKRQKESYPVILQFEKWMYETATRTSQNSRVEKAISYSLPLLPRLDRYVNDGRFRIDNNLVEGAIMPIALGRKNFLFCGNHDAAVRVAIVHIIVDSCKAMGVDPRECMENFLLRIPGNENNRNALRELLSNRWARQTN